MKKNLKAKVKADVKVYLIPRDQLQLDKKLDDKYLVYDSTKTKKG
ncbi:SIFV.gp59-like protein [Sulfolobus islandicus filamentous virus 2]|uniref:SIFV.gp59-like protein n=1 Tax=Sulfolobus islandicus filamentous virus 2 TaxID=1902331 RepID=A0A1D8BJB2_SIFV|nr:SIFV.gp59-like protein [Sulfolobus islandicus filamentous virus 2]